MGVVTFVRDGLASLVSGLGTERDKAATTYYAEPTISEEQLVNAYRGSWMARKIVDIPALDSCRAWRAWQAKAAQIEAIEAEEKRLNVKGKVLDARRKARLFGGAAVYMDFGDDASKPLDIEKVKKGGIRFLTVLSRRQLVAGDIDTDPLSEFYNRPKEYLLASGSTGQVRIHPSRLTIFYGAELPDRDYASGAAFAWADSVLVPVMDAVKQAESAAANIASLIFEANVDVIAMNGLMEKVGNPAEEEKILRRYGLAAQAKGVNKMLLIDGNEKYERKTVTFATLPDLMDRFGQNAAGAADIPMTRFMSQAPAGMNATGESDLRNYYDRIAAGQQLEMEPAMSGLDECLIRSATGARDPAIHYDWNPLWQLSEKDKADIFKTKADAARTIAGKGGMEPALMPIEALSDALVNELVEDGALAGLEAAVEEYGRLSEQEEDEADLVAATGGAGQPEKVEGTDAAPRTLYVSRKLVNADEFIAWAKGQGFSTTTPADELHVTVTYSRAPVDWMKMGENWSSDQNGNLTIEPGGARLVEPLGDKGAIVLLFNSSHLSWRHQSMIEAGASHDFPDYQPHVTITYAGSDVDLAKVEPYRGKLVFGPEIFAELDEDWSSKITEDGGGRAAVRPFDARRRKHGGHLGPRKGFDPSQPRGGDGRWIPTGRRIENALGKAGSNDIEHVMLGAVRRPAAASAVMGVDVRGYKHAASNQAMRHALKQHGDAKAEAARGQKGLTEDDFGRLPQIVRSGAYHPAEQRKFGPRRVEIHATVGPDKYVYVAEARPKQRRLDMVTMWKR